MGPGSISTHNSFSTYTLPLEVPMEHFSMGDTESYLVIFCRHSPFQAILLPVVLLIKMYEFIQWAFPERPLSEPVLWELLNNSLCILSLLEHSDCILEGDPTFRDHQSY